MKNRKNLVSLGLLLLLFLVRSVHAESFQVVGWDVESGDNDPDVIAEQIAAFQGCDLVGLCEVHEASSVTSATVSAGRTAAAWRQ